MGQIVRLGEILVGKGLATDADIEQALARQHVQGGRLGTHLVAMGVLTIEALLAILRDQRDIEGALEVCEHALRRWVSVYGERHPNTYRARYSLSRVLLGSGRTGEAVEQAKKACTGLTATLGPGHPWTVDSNQHLKQVSALLAASESAKPQPAGASA